MSRFFLDYSDENAILFTVKMNLTDPKTTYCVKKCYNTIRFSGPWGKRLLIVFRAVSRSLHRQRGGGENKKTEDLQS